MRAGKKPQKSADESSNMKRRSTGCLLANERRAERERETCVILFSLRPRESSLSEAAERSLRPCDLADTPVSAQANQSLNTLPHAGAALRFRCETSLSRLLDSIRQRELSGNLANLNWMSHFSLSLSLFSPSSVTMLFCELQNLFQFQGDAFPLGAEITVYH